MSYLEGLNRNQLVLLPGGIDDYITNENPVCVIDEYVEQLDIYKLG